MIKIRDQFLEKWDKYFPGANLPIVFFYTNEEGRGKPMPKPDEWKCVICDLGRVRKGQSISLDIDSISCSGGKRYFGFTTELRPNFDYFLSCGIPGEMEGERYKKTPGLVRKIMKYHPPYEAPGKFIVFKRWDKLEAEDSPCGVIFFAAPDVLSGLFTLANFDADHPHGVISPFCSGCSSIVYHPFMESRSDKPRAVLGMFDVSARTCVPSDVLTFSVPYSRFIEMVNNMDESFMITESWDKVRSRIKGK